jgi:class 3 adenylate cyclase
MEEMSTEALWLEALSDKVLHQLPPAVWKQLFLGEDRDSIHFEQRNVTLVHADADTDGVQTPATWASFRLELQRIALRHGGRLDPYVDAKALVTFEDPSAAIRMAMALQGAASGLGLRVGVVSGRCTLAFFRSQGRLWCTPIGAQPARAAQVAATADVGGIVISPETCAPSAAVDHFPTPDFQDAEVDLSTLAGAVTAAESLPASRALH